MSGERDATPARTERDAPLDARELTDSELDDIAGGGPPVVLFAPPEGG